MGIYKRIRKLKCEGLGSVKRLQVIKKKETSNFTDSLEKGLLIHPCPV